MKTFATASLHQMVTPRGFTNAAEIHYVPSAAHSKGRSKQDWEGASNVSAQTGAMNWAAIDPVPVRRTAGSPKGNIPALYHWQRTEEPEFVWCESQAEKNELLWLDWQGALTKVWSQPLALIHAHGTEGARYHVPDFMGMTYEGRIRLYDVRPAARIDPRTQRQFDLTAAACDELGWTYTVLDGAGRSVRASLNLQWLKAARHPRCAPPGDVEYLILLAAGSGETRAALCAAASPHDPARAAVWIDHLTWHRKLDIDINDPLSSNTVLHTNRR